MKIYNSLPHILLLTSFLCSFTVIANTAIHTAKNTTKLNTISKINAVMDKIMDENAYPGISMVISFNGNIYHHAQKGFINVETKTSANIDTKFRMYSVTKGLTILLTTKLAEQGVLGLHVPIGQYLPDLPIDKKKLTPQQLLDHKSGIRHYKGAQEWMALSQQHCQTPKDAIQYFINDPLISEPGKQEHYSSFAYVLLSAVIEASSGLTLENVMDKYLFSKSNVSRVTFDDPTAYNKDVNTSTFYEKANNIQIIAPAVDNSCKFGSGNINASPLEISHIFSAMYANNSASTDTFKKLFPLLSVSGEGLGGRSTLLVDPSNNVVIVIAANARGGNLQPYANEISDIIRLNQPLQN